MTGVGGGTPVLVKKKKKLLNDVIMLKGLEANDKYRYKNFSHTHISDIRSYFIKYNLNHY